MNQNGFYLDVIEKYRSYKKSSETFKAAKATLDAGQGAMN
jgi:hypothetical protein